MTSFDIHKNLPTTDFAHLEEHFKKLQVGTCCISNNVFEVDVPGVQLLTKLSENELNYRVLGQSMSIDHTIIGGGTVKVQKIVWTLGKE